MVEGQRSELDIGFVQPPLHREDAVPLPEDGED